MLTIAPEGSWMTGKVRFLSRTTLATWLADCRLSLVTATFYTRSEYSSYSSCKTGNSSMHGGHVVAHTSITTGLTPK